MPDPQEPRPRPSCGRTRDHLGCTCQTCCSASAMTTNTEPQEPRTGGGIDILPGLRTYTSEDAERANALGPARLYSLAEAESLIDPNDPAVAERILAIGGGGLFEQWEVDLILAALRSKGGTDAR